MTETVDPPTLTLGPEITRMLAALAYTAGHRLRGRGGGRAEPDATSAADRDVDRAAARRADLSDPPVRTLFDAEATGFDVAQAEHQEHTGPDGPVRVAVGPLTDSRWALVAQTQTDGGDLVAAVRCRDEHTARAVAEEALARGPGAVGRLHQVAEAAAGWAAQAARGQVEPDDQLAARAARALHDAWPGHARAVEQVVHGRGAARPGGQAQPGSVRPDFAALADQLGRLEARGYSMVAVLRAVDPRCVDRAGSTTPATAVSDHITRSLTGIAVVNLGGPIRPAWQGTRRAGSGDDLDVAPVLAVVLSEQTLAKVRGDDRYGDLVTDLRTRADRGEDLPGLLARLSTAAVDGTDRARHPAAWLAGCLRAADRAAARRTARRQGNDQQTGPDADFDDVDVAPVLAVVLSEQTLAKVRGDDRYGDLVTDLRARADRGEDLPGLLARLSTAAVDGTDRARHPAAYLEACVRRVADRVVVDGEVIEANATKARAGRRPGGDGSLTDAAQHAATATAEDARADEHERAAAGGRETPDDPGTPQREDLHTGGKARIDDTLAAAARATARAAAGGEHSAAAAARAALTAPSAGQGQRPPGPRRTAGPAPRRYGGPQNTPHRQPRRSP